jgi:SRSO17 transposase
VVIDETSFPKQGKKSAGVGVQYCRTTGQARELSGGRLSLICHRHRAYAH